MERIQDIHPLLFDIDLKYKTKLEERSFDESTLKELVSLLWSKANEAFEISDPINQGQIWVMMKPNPYPCKSKDFESKDGIHIVFPNIIVKRDQCAYPTGPVHFEARVNRINYIHSTGMIYESSLFRKMRLGDDRHCR